MAEYDLVIRGGIIVDGTGIPRYKGDLAIKDGRVARISGQISTGGAKEIDASGCFVAPGAVDLHTHYDAQLNWDRYCSMSGWFGVTSLTIGQCGFGFAPTRPADRDLNMRMMNRIEAIPLRSMQVGMRWGLGDLPRVPRQPGEPWPGPQRRAPVPLLSDAGLRTGDATRQGEDLCDRGGAEPDEGDVRRGDEGRSIRILPEHEPGRTGPTTAASCPARSLPTRSSSRWQRSCAGTAWATLATPSASA